MVQWLLYISGYCISVVTVYLWLLYISGYCGYQNDVLRKNVVNVKKYSPSTSDACVMILLYLLKKKVVSSDAIFLYFYVTDFYKKIFYVNFLIYVIQCANIFFHFQKGATDEKGFGKTY